MMVLYHMQQYTASVHSMALKSLQLGGETAASHSLGRKDHGRHHQQRRSEV